MKTQQTDSPADAGAVFATMENLQMEQLRLENVWLRQRMHAMMKLTRSRTRPVLVLQGETQHAQECRCQLCRK